MREVREHAGLVQAFEAWADANGYRRFWGVARLPDMRIALTLPTATDSFRAVIVPGSCLDDKSVYISVGPAKIHAVSPLQYLVGTTSDDPGLLMVKARAWLRDISDEYLEIDPEVTSYETAHIASVIANAMGDFEAEKRAIAARDAARG